MIAAEPGGEQVPSITLVGDSARGGPTVLRMVLGMHLRGLREAAGISREDAGESIRASGAKISRLELGRVGCKLRDLNDLLTYYGVSDEQERQAFLALAQQGSSSGWWHRYGDVLPSWFEVYVGLEQAASIIRTFQVQFVPGLLQTEAYARAVIRLSTPTIEADEIERRVGSQMARQEFIGQPDAPSLWAVIDEAALRRPPGDPALMRGQLQNLIDMAHRRNITIQLVPFELGGHVAGGGPFTILRFPEPDLPDVVYLEQLNSAIYLEKRQDVDGYRVVMDRVCTRALSPAQTLETIDKIM
jgi:hypothetical protein